MNNYIRLVFYGLVCSPITASLAIPLQQADSVQRQERQKGRLWTVAVHQGWPTLARQPQWPTKDSLDAWLNAQESQNKELRNFRQQIVTYVRDSLKQHVNQRTASAQPTELKKVFETQLPLFLSKNHRPLTTAQRQELSQSLQVALIDSTPAPAPTPMASLPSSTADQTVSTQSESTGSPTQGSSSLLIGLAGIAIGFTAGLLTSKIRKPTSPSSTSDTESSKEADRKLFKQQALDQVQKGNRLKDTPTPSIKSTALPVSVSPAPELLSASLSMEEQNKPATDALPAGSEISLEVAAPAEIVSMPSTYLFGPSPDTPAIEARKFSPQSLPQMPICLKLDTTEATTGRFELNPYAEQSRLIGNGIRELRTFFEFDLPLPESFTTLTTTKSGVLELRDGVWHLIDKAKIDLT